MQVHFQRIHPNAKLPTRAHPSDAGYDVYAALDTPLRIIPGSSAMISAGFKIGIMPLADLPDGQTFDLEHQTDGSYLLGKGSKHNQLLQMVPFVWTVDVRSRSGLAAKYNVFVANSPGTIDQNYRGEIKIILYNAGAVDFIVEPGDRIAQLVVNRAFQPAFVEVDSLEETDRGAKGFGSTGV